MRRNNPESAAVGRLKADMTTRHSRPTEDHHPTTPLPSASPPTVELPPASRTFLDRVVDLRLLSPSAVGRFLQDAGSAATAVDTPDALGQALVRAGLLTDYQLDRVIAGTTHGLVLGNYRVVERLGAGGMSYVFLAEHCLMRRRVAVKVLPVGDDCPSSVRHRFYAEMRVLAELHHPNIVLALDAGEVPSPGGRLPALMYLVMEVIAGGDLEQHVVIHGPRPVSQACEWIRQAAAGLQEAHDRHLIHRDIKPSNLLLSGEEQVKVVDFGLARQFSSSLTDPRVLLGSIEFMAPEQSFDPSAVGGAADIYGLGATLFWLLTGEAPYPAAKSVGAGLRAIQQDPPRRVRAVRPDVPADLDHCVAQMLARDPRERPAMPLAVMNALAPFALADRPLSATVRFPRARSAPESASSIASTSLRRVLIVDDEPSIREISRAILEPAGCACDEAETGAQALARVYEQPYELILLDLGLPDVDGFDVCLRLRERPPLANLKIIVVSGRGDQDELAMSLPRGADDYIPKPFRPPQLDAKVRHLLHLKDAQDRADRMAEQLRMTNIQLESGLRARDADVRQAHNALLLGLAKMAESRDGETAGHLHRLQLYCRCLAEKAAVADPWHGLVDSRFLEQLGRCVPLHDIGKIGLPDEVLLKAGSLTPQERAVVEMHPVLGDRILQTLAQQHGGSLEFLGMARGIVRHHHERFDGKGYPDRLVAEGIPAGARLVAVADVYDALRRQRPHKSPYSHADAVRIILHESPGQFDPSLLVAFCYCNEEFQDIFRRTGG
jgi:response regulator RpfG family c-di-GMP phosphodiesterase